MSTAKNSIPPKDDTEQKPKESVAPLEEDDEFEDFPVEGPSSALAPPTNPLRVS